MSRAWPIRDKLLLVGLLVAVVVGTLSASSFVGIYSYRRLVRSLSSRAAELPLASEVSRSVDRLRFNYARHQSLGQRVSTGFLRRTYLRQRRFLQR